MANVLTDLAGDIYKAADVVGRELVGFAPSSMFNADGSERAAVGDTVRSHFTRQATAVTATASMTVPEGTDQTVDNKTLSITKDRAVQIPWTGEDVRHVDNGSGWATVYGDQIEQAMRTLANEAETDLAVEAATNASRAVGTAGTTPFGSNFDEVALARQVLVDNGMATGDGRATLVLNTAAGANLRNLASLQGVNTAGNDRLLRQGTLLDLQGLMLKESAQVQTSATSAGSGYLINGTFAVGDTVIGVDTGTGALAAGETFTIAGDTNIYVVIEAYAGGAGNITIGSPGLRVAPADSAAITIAAAATQNVAFHQSALEIAMRAPALPEGGDAAIDRMTVQDPASGLVFEIAAYVGYRKAMFSVGAVWGVKAWKPDNIALLLG
jgi:hypothetical protein